MKIYVNCLDIKIWNKYFCISATPQTKAQQKQGNHLSSLFFIVWCMNACTKVMSLDFICLVHIWCASNVNHLIHWWGRFTGKPLKRRLPLWCESSYSLLYNFTNNPIRFKPVWCNSEEAHLRCTMHNRACSRTSQACLSHHQIVFGIISYICQTQPKYQKVCTETATPSEFGIYKLWYACHTRLSNIVL